MNLKKTERCDYCNEDRPLFYAMEDRRVYRVIHHLPTGLTRCLRCGNPDMWHTMTDPAEIKRRVDHRKAQQELVVNAVKKLKRQQRWRRIKRTLRMR